MTHLEKALPAGVRGYLSGLDFPAGRTELLAAALRDAGVLDGDRRQSIEAEVDGEIQRAVAVAETGPLEPVEDLTRHVMSEPA